MSMMLRQDFVLFRLVNVLSFEPRSTSNTWKTEGQVRKDLSEQKSNYSFIEHIRFLSISTQFNSRESKYFSQQKQQEDNQKFISNTLFVIASRQKDGRIHDWKFENWSTFQNSLSKTC